MFNFKNKLVLSSTLYAVLFLLFCVTCIALQFSCNGSNAVSPDVGNIEPGNLPDALPSGFHYLYYDDIPYWKTFVVRFYRDLQYEGVVDGNDYQVYVSTVLGDAITVRLTIRKDDASHQVLYDEFEDFNGGSSVTHDVGDLDYTGDVEFELILSADDEIEDSAGTVIGAYYN